MKKTLSFLLVALMMLSTLALVGCGGGSSSDSGEAPAADSQYIGVWKATKGMYKDEEVAIEEVLTDTNGVYELNLKEDGTVVITTDKEDSGTWTEISNGVHVKAPDTDTDFINEDGNLILEFMGFKLVFEKQ